MNKALLAIILGLVLAVSAVSAVSAEDATRSATRKAAEDSIRQAKQANRSADQATKFKESANKFIDERIASLNKAIARVNSANRLTSADKAELVADLNSAITRLTNLKAKIAAETSAEAVKADLKSIFSDFKIFAVLEPKTQGLTAAAKMSFQVDKLSLAADKINALVVKAQTAGKNTTAMKALFTDYQTQISDAKKQIAAAKAKFTAMKVSDPTGAKTLFQDGKAILKLAKADIIAAHKDLQQIIPLLRVIRGNDDKDASGSAKPATRSATPATSSATN